MVVDEQCARVAADPLELGAVALVAGARTIVLDCRSGMCKVGFADCGQPHATFRTVVGRPRYRKLMTINDQKDVYVGGDALTKRAVLTLAEPIARGVVASWDDCERVWHHAFFNELRTQPADHPLVLVEPILNPRADRERMAAIMFATFCVPAIFVGAQSVLAIHGANRVTGLVCDSGEGFTHLVPMHAGFAISHAIVRVEAGGKDVTEMFGKFLAEAGLNLTTGSQIELVREAKEAQAYVALRPAEEQAAAGHVGAADRPRLVLPDGTVHTLGTERFMCAEILFGEVAHGLRSQPMQAGVVDAISRCQSALHAELYANVVLAGGCTCLAGFGDRLRREVAELSPAAHVHVVEVEGRQHLAWTGGAALAGLARVEALWVTRAQYQATSAAALHQGAFLGRADRGEAAEGAG
ncbi:hypothetical protein KFE25_006497 [Diacronema lutheri]|uniref:Actin n=1 Tax=Diacronema lutheri TaxID=2081491 RepID=A0A8J5XWZ3_DIALT|nr:hypothetical protein KFE25_006497 [Diacronema lutheri]